VKPPQYKEKILAYREEKTDKVEKVLLGLYLVGIVFLVALVGIVIVMKMIHPG
jgi:cell division protein FtsL